MPVSPGYARRLRPARTPPGNRFPSAGPTPASWLYSAVVRPQEEDFHRCSAAPRRGRSPCVGFRDRSCKEHGLVQLQFELASDIDAESHVDFSRPSMMVLIRTVSTSTCMSVSTTANVWRTLAGLPGPAKKGSPFPCSESARARALLAS